jgi:uncharacterized protein YcfJ
LTALTLAVAGLSGSAFAERGNNRNIDQNAARSDRARVTQVEQLQSRRDSYTRQECWNESSSRNEGGYYRDSNGRLYRQGDGRKSGSTGGAIIGALVGGALGNQVGKGDGRKAATIAGAVIGATIGSKHSRDGYDRYRDDSGTEVHCRTVADNDYRSRYGDQHYPDYTSYRVTYSYAGQSYQSFTNNRPGRYVQVLVDVQLRD